MRSSRSCRIAHSTGGDWRSQRRNWERCIDGMVAVAEVASGREVGETCCEAS